MFNYPKNPNNLQIEPMFEANTWFLAVVSGIYRPGIKKSRSQSRNDSSELVTQSHFLFKMSSFNKVIPSALILTRYMPEAFPDILKVIWSPVRY